MTTPERRVIIEYLYRQSLPVPRDLLVMEVRRQTGTDFSETHKIIDRMEGAGIIKYRGGGYYAVRNQL
jgi:DNA-binding MarR family transcriptional regulator